MTEVLYDDADLAVVVKEAGRSVHPSPGYETGSLAKRADKRRMRVVAVGTPSAQSAVTHWEVLSRHRSARLLLHAVELAFAHPVTGKALRFVAAVPREIVFAG